MSPSVDGPTAIPSLPPSNTNPVTHLANHSSPVASFLGGAQRMAQAEVGPQERQEPPTHSLRIPVPGSRPGSTGALPVALSPLRGRTGAELRNRGLRALPLASALAQGRHRGALFHLGYLPGIPSPPQDCRLLLLQASHGLCFPPTEDLGTVTSGPRRRCLPFQILQWGAQAFIPAAELPRLCASCQCIDRRVPSGVGHLGRAWSLPPLHSPQSLRCTGITIPCDSRDVQTV